MLTLPVTIHKSDISPCGKLKGVANSHPFTVEERTYSAGQLVFLGFRGADDGTLTQSYAGVFCFELGQAETSVDFNQLPGIKDTEDARNSHD